MPSTIRILVLSDELAVRTRLRILLSGARDLRLVGEATELQELPHLCSLTQPQIVLMFWGG